MAARGGLWALWALLGVAFGPGAAPGGSLGVAATPQVPLLVWSTERSLWPPLDAPGGRVVSEEQLEELLKPALERGPRTVLLFLQDQLSLEDFTAFGGVFGNEPGGAFARLEAALGSAGSSLTLPGVSGAAVAALPHTLQRGLGAPAPLRLPHRDPPAPLQGLGGLRLNQSQPALLLVGLPHSASSGLMGPREVLTNNDLVLGEVLQVLQDEAVPYTALFTARRPSRAPRGAPEGSLGGPHRALLGQEELWGGPAPPPLRWPPSGTPKILFWARNVSVWYKGQHRDLTGATLGQGATVELGGSSWDPQEARLVLQYKEVFGGTLNITLLFRRSWFPVSGRPWAGLAEVGVGFLGGPPARFGARGGFAPSPLSWSCAELGAPGPLLLPLSPPETTREWRLRMGGVQFQAFNVSGGSFGGSSDCSGFFSAGGWMGLISGGLLLGGLLLGGALLGGLRPMDRFDDPRGPPLPVPLTE